jgi:hypothetical protein
MSNPEPGHILNEAWNPKNAEKVCPTCGKDFRHWHVENYDPIWMDGDVVCECGTRIRGYDAG